MDDELLKISSSEGHEFDQCAVDCAKDFVAKKEGMRLVMKTGKVFEMEKKINCLAARRR